MAGFRGSPVSTIIGRSWIPDPADTGQGVARDSREALTWFRKAAEQGLAEAQNNLGAFYHQGWGQDRDYAQALYWYRKAAEKGLTGAEGNLGVLVDQPQQMVFRNLIFRAEVIEQRFGTVVLPHLDQQASDDQNQAEHGQMLSS
jgi:hypothetical protein